MTNMVYFVFLKFVICLHQDIKIFPIHFPQFSLFKLRYSMFTAPLAIRSSPIAEPFAICRAIRCRFSMSPDAFHSIHMYFSIIYGGKSSIIQDCTVLLDVATYDLTSWRTFFVAWHIFTSIHHDILSILFDVMTCHDVLLILWRTFHIFLTWFLTLWHMFWRQDVFYVLLRYGVLLDPKTNLWTSWRIFLIFEVIFVTPWRSFWWLGLRLRLHWFETSQVSTWPHQLEDVEESHSVASPWYTFHTFWRNDVHFDVTVYFVMSLRTLWHMLWRHGKLSILVDVIKYILMSGSRSPKIWISHKH